ncbi:MAG TPA: bifunctional salicylyl-CoA 5-hydroxylase/oxidoreductase [Gemmatimonadaceae bacterium]|nr:bifunctional salicylyl-CoA 5-hydroxylase/oxidoreductase [Gemmatimonadaceae bacterium]
MKIAIIGGGPAGLYAALLLKRADPGHEVTVLERNARDDSFGWGVVFSDQTLANVQAVDPDTYEAIGRHLAHWDDIDVHVHGRMITSGGHGFSGIARRTLLRLLAERASSFGVDIRWRTEVAGVQSLAAHGLADADLVIGADGINSGVRREFADVFRPQLETRHAPFVWLGTRRLFDAFTFLFVQNEQGTFQAHAYRFDADHSAFIVECDELSWRAAGFDRMDTPATIAACERMFEPWLEGHALESNAAHRDASPWTRFQVVRNERWFDGRVVLIGDAAHTAHFSIGSGTKLALEDAIALARVIAEAGDAVRDQGSAPLSVGAGEVARAPSLETLLERYQQERMTEALRLQNAARNSMEWFEHAGRYMRLEPEQFAYSLLTRSQRVSHENLRLRDGAYLGGVERWFAARAGVPVADQSVPAPPPIFTPLTLRELTLTNRVVVSPMDMYVAVDGVPDDFHLVHYGARALGGAGLVITEMTCVSAEGRISPGCTGIWSDEQAAAWSRITRFVHDRSPAAICLQLGHSGRKGSTRASLEEGDLPLEADNWELIAPSPFAHRDGMRTPREMTRADMDHVREEFVAAARRAIGAGFDMLELHCAHGYLLSSFITPLGNRRTDDFGGSLENRLRFPLEVFGAVRAVWPEARPMSVRISATDWVPGGVDGADAVRIARAFTDAGADIIHVSTGQTSPDARPVYGRLWQTPLSDRVRNEGGVRTIAVGNVTEADQVNAVIAAGRADLVALGRPHLADPQWTLRAAAQLGWTAQWWPRSYRSGQSQMERLFARERGG